MPELQEIKRTLSRIEKLEREVNLKQLQINSLLTITQAINENVAADGLFNMYSSFLRWEIGIRKMALFFKETGKWECMSASGVDEALFEHDVNDELSRYRNKQGLEGSSHPLIREFDLVIPVMHKNEPIAYAFVGGFGDDDDVYNKVQFVTTITNVIAVAIENKRLFKQQLRQEILNREVEVAAEIQRTLVPSRLPSGKKYQLSSIYKPHFAVGGDYYDVVEYPDGKIAFCIADITGKGVSAALLMANFQANFHALITRRTTLEEIVQEMNAAVYRVTQGDKFITLFLAKYDPATRTLNYINAGHAPPLMLTQGEVTPLKNGCTVLGWLPELPFLETGGLCLTDEALIFTYTDGLTDVRNKAGEDFAEEKLVAFLRENTSLGAKELNTKLLAHIENYRERQPYPDDITVLTCKILAEDKYDSRLVITVEKNFTEFTDENKEEFLAWLKKELETNSLKITGVEPGSVIVTIELPKNAADKFLKLLYSNKLARYEITEASLVYYDDRTQSPKLRRYQKGNQLEPESHDFEQWKLILKDKIADDAVDEVFSEIKKSLIPTCRAYNELITLMARYNSNRRDILQMGDKKDGMIVSASIISAVISTIDSLQTKDLINLSQ